MKTSVPASREELLKSFTRKKADEPEKLLQACMGSFYPDDSVDHKVTIRFIELVDNNQAIITARVLNEFYFAEVSRDLAVNSSTPYDIIVENGEYRHIRQKIISNTNNQTRLQTLELPPEEVESGAVNRIALYAPKNTVLRLDGFLDTVKYRTLYHLQNNTRKFVIKTIGDKIFEHNIEPGTGPFGVPGDFEIHEDAGYINMITHRLMPGNDFVRDDGTPILLP